MSELPDRPHAMIFEFGVTGHRMTYVRQLLLGLTELADVTLVVSKDAPSSDEFRVQVGDHFPSVTVDASIETPTLSGLKAMRAQAASVEAAAKKHAPDLFYMPTADGVTQALGLPPAIHLPMRAEAAMHRGSWAYPRPTFKQTIAARASLALTSRSPWDRLLMVDPLGYEWIRDHRPTLAKRCDVLPDPVDPVEDIDRHAARERLAIPAEGRLLGLMGMIDRRKGAHHLVPAFAKASLQPDDRLLLAGRVADQLRPVIETHQHLIDEGRLIVLDRYITDEEFALALAASDVVVTSHDGHVGLSNVALRAAAAGRMVLGSDWGWQRRIVEPFDLGRVVNVTDHDAFARAIAESLEAAPTYKPTARTHRLMEFHSRANFTAQWLAPLRERLSLPPDPSLRTWEWLNGGG